MKLAVLFIAGIILTSAIPLSSGGENLTKDLINQINEEILRYYLTTLVSFAPRYTGSQQLREAEEWIFNELNSYGLNVSYYEWKMGGFEDRDIVATLDGDDDYIIIIGSHVDTVENSPGADDNGSGVAVILALAKIFSQYHFLHTIRFLFYTGEEVGTYGSYNYARYAYESGDKIIASFNLDMVGYANTSKGGKYVRFFETERGKKITNFCMEIYEKYYDLVGLNIERVPNYPGSDHQAYIDYGYDAVFIAHYDGYPYGHSPNDSIDKINFTYETKVARLFTAVLSEIANEPVETYISIKEPKEGYLYLMNRALIPIISKTWYLGLRGITVVIGSISVVAEVDGEVEKIIFAVDDRMWKWDYLEPYEWEINSLIIGKHYLKVYAYGTKVATDEMDLLTFILYVPSK
ncbi:MAG TPA: Zn-dependent exopeptidase M28 [Thermoplasmatales archaeon]|nr:Zn-dependent exopeptidase M28 [Thermoplasmatales archaeon]